MKFFTVILLFLLFSGSVFSKDSFKYELPRELYEPEGIETMRLIDAELHYTKEKGIYLDECNKKIDTLFETANIIANEENILKYSGNWIIVDKNNNSVERYSVSAPKLFFIENINDYLRYRRAESISYLYFYKDNLYISPNIHFAIIAKLILIDNRLYFYILENDKWVLSPIHDGGKYYYIKEP
ncbi:MAG: hypothetical protein LBL64_06970 [Treponema sp.]|nr:hypothetical protein [Treponema sp.]